ncbi:MAG: hypothetical protein QOH35_3727, partial [Acidobacteriaceae bacterium]|nr:hypothetical protein [Acidobacteriaceae bacterium]
LSLRSGVASTPGNQSFKGPPFQWIVVRSTSEAIVVNLRDDLWDELNLISTGLRAEA